MLETVTGLEIIWKATLQDRVSCDFTEVDWCEVPDLFGNAVPQLWCFIHVCLDNTRKWWIVVLWEQWNVYTHRCQASLPSMAPGFFCKTLCETQEVFYPALLGLMKHQRVVRGQGHIETTLEVYREWALLIGQEPSRQWCKGWCSIKADRESPRGASSTSLTSRVARQDPSASPSNSWLFEHGDIARPICAK